MQSTDDGIGLPAEDGVRILEAPGMLNTMLFLRSVGQCKKTDLYRAIGRRVGMAVKLDRLERAGLIVQEEHQRMTLLYLTRDGRAVADMIERIRQVIGEGEVREDRSFSPDRCRDVVFRRVGGPGWGSLTDMISIALNRKQCPHQRTLSSPSQSGRASSFSRSHH